MPPFRRLLGCQGEGQLIGIARDNLPGSFTLNCVHMETAHPQPTPSRSSLCELLKYLLSLGTGCAGLGGEGVSKAVRSCPVSFPSLQAVLSWRGHLKPAPGFQSGRASF